MHACVFKLERVYFARSLWSSALVNLVHTPVADSAEGSVSEGL